MSGDREGQCWNCGKGVAANNYGRADTCDHCGKDSRSCKNCEFHDRSYNNECRENQADRVVEKEKANFCDYFQPSARGGKGAPSKDELKSAAEALFKK